MGFAGAEYHVDVYKRLPLLIERGAGTTVVDSDGREYLDLISGLGVTGLGHAHPGVAAALAEQAKTLVHVSNLFYNGPQLALTRKLVDLTFPGSGSDPAARVFLANSGAEAVEAAIKLARRYGHDKGERHGIIAAERSFHGRTMGALSATGQPDKQRGFEPLLPGFTHVPFNDIEALAAAVEPTTIAILLEPVQGEAGVHPATPEYLSAVRELCDERDLLLILDEVQTGMGRTGRLFAFEHYGVEPDILVTAKGLGNGFPIGALIAKAHVADAFHPGDHASTFGGNPLACAAALATLEIITSAGFLDRVEARAAGLRAGLESLVGAGLSEVRGIGLMLGMTLTSRQAPKVMEELLERGFIVNAMGEETLRLLPPLVIGQDEIDRFLAALTDVLGGAR